MRFMLVLAATGLAMLTEQAPLAGLFVRFIIGGAEVLGAIGLILPGVSAMLDFIRLAVVMVSCVNTCVAG